MLRTVTATRYVTPFREGSSMPALMEADDDGLYVVKFRGAGQGPAALIAELISGELGRAVGLHVPELAFIDLSAEFGRTEPDPEISDLLEASTGVNLGLDFLPGSITFDGVAGPSPDPALASLIVLFDAFITNVDRTPKNPNLLIWHKRLWLIDHGASLYFHHGWSRSDRLEGSRDPFAHVRQHVLLPWASRLGEAAAALRAAWTPGTFERVTGAIPPAWLSADAGFSDPDAHRAAYGAWLHARLDALPIYLEEAERARAQRV